MTADTHGKGTSDGARIAFMFAAAALIFVIDGATELGVADGVLYAGVIWLSRNLSQPRYIAGSAIACSVLTLLGLLFSPPGGEAWKAVANRFIALYAIWLTAILLTRVRKSELERETVIDELRKALAGIRTLRGLLPICASCKKIRDDKGYWNQVEVYVRDHSEAEFSHGLCPDCAAKAYEDLKRRKKQSDEG